MTVPEPLHAIIDRIYAGAVDEAARGWHDAAAMIESQTGGIAALTLEDTRAREVDAFIAPSIPGAYVASYGEHYVKVNPWLPLLPEHEGELPLDGDSLLDPRDLLRSEYYADWLRPQSLRYATGIDMFREPGRVMLLSLLLPPDHPPGEAEHRLLTMLKPHLRRAAQVRRQMSAAWAARSTADLMLDRIATGLFLLDGRGRVTAMNSRAQALVESRDGLALDPAGRLRATQGDGAERLHTLVASAAAVAAGGAGGALVLRRATGEQRLHVLVAPAGTGGSWFGRPAHAVAVFVHDPATTGRPSPERLGDLFGLTQTEARILAAIAGGATVTEVATEQGVAVSTVRHHLKHLFGKTGVNRQADLVRLVLQDPLAQQRDASAPVDAAKEKAAQRCAARV